MDTLAMLSGESLEADAQECSLRLTGSFARLALRGRENFVTVQGRLDRLEVEGDHNQVECAEMPGQIWLRGKGQRVRIVERPGTIRPEVHVEGNDQAVTYMAAP